MVLQRHCQGCGFLSLKKGTSSAKNLTALSRIFKVKAMTPGGSRSCSIRVSESTLSVKRFNSSVAVFPFTYLILSITLAVWKIQ